MTLFGLKLNRLDTALLALAAAAVVLWLLRWAVPAADAGLAGLQGLLFIGFGLLVAYRLMETGRWVARRFLWPVRNRMIAVFFFVGALPISLGALVVAFGLVVLLGPITAHLLTLELTRKATSMAAAATPLLWQLREAEPEDWLDLTSRYHAQAQREFPGLVLQAEVDGHSVLYPVGSQAGVLPTHLAGGGMVRKTDGYYLAAVAQEAPADGYVMALAPVTSSTISGLMPGLGVLEIPAAPVAEEGRRPADAIRDAVPIGGGLPPAAAPLDWQINWPIQATVLDPASAETRSVTFLLRTRPSAVWQRLFAQETEMTFGLFTILGGILAALFVGNLVVSMIVAVSLTRTLTRSVNDLYVGTTHVNRGDFAHRIDVRGTDQLSDLSRSFNSMSASVEQLMEDSKRRQQLEAELETAREVQARLFPASAPELDDLELLGVCRPALSVSGDFFDYLRLEDGKLAISIGDISGKGISAALVMASMHSTLRTQIALLHPNHPQGLERATSRVVEHANEQLCERTAPDKFSTLFFAAYDPAASALTYSNAGHLPPLLLREGEISRLDVHGMIVGAFPQAEYSATSLTLASGDLLVAYTDGVTEPENFLEEEYGEQRLEEAVRRHANQPLQGLIENIMDDVVQWTGESALQDDMTILVLRKR